MLLYQPINRRRTCSSMRSISTPVSVFVFGFRASQKCIRRNRNSSWCGRIVTSLKNITSSPCAEEDCDLGMAEETAVLPFGLIAISEAATDFPVGVFEIAEEERIFRFGFRSLDTGDLPVDSIAVYSWEDIIDFNRSKIWEKCFIERLIEGKTKGNLWMSYDYTKVWLEKIVKRWFVWSTKRFWGDEEWKMRSRIRRLCSTCLNDEFMFDRPKY